MKLFSIGIAAFLMLFLSVSSFGQMKEKSSKTVFKGYLVDKMCGSGMSKKSEDKAMMMAAKHTRECAMAEDCAASGYGVVYDGKWHAFDTEGSKKAASYLAKSKKKDHLFVAVTGMKKGDEIMVSSIETAKEMMGKTEKSGTMDKMKMEKKDDMKKMN